MEWSSKLTTQASREHVQTHGTEQHAPECTAGHRRNQKRNQRHQEKGKDLERASVFGAQDKGRWQSKATQLEAALEIPAPAESTPHSVACGHRDLIFTVVPFPVFTLHETWLQSQSTKQRLTQNSRQVNIQLCWSIWQENTLIPRIICFPAC